MEIEKIQLGKKKVMPFTIPSGIVTTQVSSLEKLAREIPELGILTTKSIGPEKRAGNREPILAQYAPYCFVNAVGLTNPGAEEFARELGESDFPEEKFLLASIFGANSEEFVHVAKTLEDRVDGFELNLSCPHAKGYGMQLGQDPNIVWEITRAVVRETSKPVFAKLTPNAGNIGEIAKAAVDAGAYGLVAINTVGPGYHSVRGNPVLRNKIGGLSGIGIMPIGLKCVRDVRQAVGDKIPIIGMGGISTASDIEEYAKAGANIFGVGSALAGMTDGEIRAYFLALVGDLRNNGRTTNASQFVRNMRMDYHKVEIEERSDLASDFKIFRTDVAIRALPGQFVFAWSPEVGEKPFSVMDTDPLTLGVQEVGEFTEAFNKLKEGDHFYFRGPYGRGVERDPEKQQVLVGGGCGIAGITLFAKSWRGGRRLKILVGAKDKSHIPFFEELCLWGETYVATEDGSHGLKGKVSDLIPIAHLPHGGSYQFYNCGPKKMIEAILPLERRFAEDEDIHSSVDYITSCGVGICGKCADERGRRTCVEGPFMSLR